MSITLRNHVELDMQARIHLKTKKTDLSMHSFRFSISPFTLFEAEKIYIGLENVGCFLSLILFHYESSKKYLPDERNVSIFSLNGSRFSSDEAVITFFDFVSQAEIQIF